MKIIEFNNTYKIFSKFNCNVYKAELIDTHGGSIRIYINRSLKKIDTIP